MLLLIQEEISVDKTYVGSTISSCVCEKSTCICPSVLVIHNTSSKSDKLTYICPILLVGL